MRSSHRLFPTTGEGTKADHFLTTEKGQNALLAPPFPYVGEETKRSQPVRRGMSL